MKRDVVLRPDQFYKSSFLSCEKDAEEIMKRLFLTSKPYSDYLKRLLIINSKDCLDNMDSQVYRDAINKTSLADLRDKGYIRFEPKISMGEHEEVKSYIVLSFDSFKPTATNPEFRDCVVQFDILCHTDYWDLGDFRLRPLKIAGYIDGILNKTRLSGIGTFQFAACNELVLDEVLSGYTLLYSAVHGSDDLIPRD